MNTTQLSPLVDERYNASAGIDYASFSYDGHWVPSRYTRRVFAITFNLVLMPIVCAFGFMSNIVNILVFYRQGPMSSSPMVMLTGLAVSDLCVPIFGLCQVFFKIMEWYVARIAFGWFVQHLLVVSTNRPLHVMIQVTCWIMTLLTLERAVSVTFPFKVKAVFTPRRSLALVVAIFVVTFVLHIPSLTLYKSEWRYSSGHPRPFRRAVYSHIFPRSVYEAARSINSVVLAFSCVFIVVVCNVIIACKVRSSQRFRKSKAATTSDEASHTQDGKNTETKSKGNNPSNKDIKDRKLLRMITVVAEVFLFCFSFSIINTVVMDLVLTSHEDYHVLSGNMVKTVIQLLKFFNSCINAVIYFNMSARYKEELLLLCGKKTR